MFTNAREHLAASPDQLFLLVATAAIFGFAVFHLIRAQQTYGTLRFAGTATKWSGAIFGALLVLQLFQATRPYMPPPSDQLAIVIGNTQNSPKPAISATTSDLIQESLLLHRGEEAEDVLSAMVFVSATGAPAMLPLDAEATGFVSMSTNSTRAKRDARNNANALKTFLDSHLPTTNGASYLEAIIEASRNVEPGATITVIGSGLSDVGDLDFAHESLLTSEKNRAAKVESLTEKYGRDYLDGYSVHFVGLGDTTKPQEPLSQKQKDIVRAMYRDSVRALGGRVTVSTRSQIGEAVKTTFTVSTTDTGCGNVNYTFDDRTLEFISDRADFTKPSKAKSALKRVVKVYDDDPSRVEQITVDGYIYLTSEQRKLPGAKSEPLSKKRAEAVEKLLVDQGIPADKIVSRGRGPGPHNDADNPGLDRMVKIKIDRSENPDC